MGAPSLWPLLLRSWQDPKSKIPLNQLMALIDPDVRQLDRGVQPWCRQCIDLALIEGGSWTDPKAYPTASGHPERICRACDSCDYRGCEIHQEDHDENTGHMSHGLELEAED